MKMEQKQYESLKAKLKKLLALSERGEAGEADNARMILEKLCRQYGISISDLLDEEKTKVYTFSIGRKSIYRILFGQCYAKVTHKKQIRMLRLSRDRVAIKLTALQYAELSSLFIWHQANFTKEFVEMEKTFTDAYISKHDLYGSQKAANNEELTFEDLERLHKMLIMRETLSDKTYQKLLMNEP
jgi:hypothetical protein